MGEVIALASLGTPGSSCCRGADSRATDGRSAWVCWMGEVIALASLGTPGLSCCRSAELLRRRDASVSSQELRKPAPPPQKQPPRRELLVHAHFSHPAIGRGSAGLTGLRDLQH